MQEYDESVKFGGRIIMERSLTMELVRVTEAAALAVGTLDGTRKKRRSRRCCNNGNA